LLDRQQIEIADNAIKRLDFFLAAALCRVLQDTYAVVDADPWLVPVRGEAIRNGIVRIEQIRSQAAAGIRIA
jgi:hypothetical protein